VYIVKKPSITVSNFPSRISSLPGYVSNTVVTLNSAENFTPVSLGKELGGWLFQLFHCLDRNSKFLRMKGKR